MFFSGQRHRDLRRGRSRRLAGPGLRRSVDQRTSTPALDGQQGQRPQGRVSGHVGQRDSAACASWPPSNKPCQRRDHRRPPGNVGPDCCLCRSVWTCPTPGGGKTFRTSRARTSFVRATRFAAGEPSATRRTNGEPTTRSRSLGLVKKIVEGRVPRPGAHGPAGVIDRQQDTGSFPAWHRAVPQRHRRRRPPPAAVALPKAFFRGSRRRGPSPAPDPFGQAGDPRPDRLHSDLWAAWRTLQRTSRVHQVVHPARGLRNRARPARGLVMSTSP